MSQKGHISSEKFVRLYSEYRQRYITIAKSYVHDEHVAEDIVTDSFIYYWEHRDELEPEKSPQAYILGIVKNKCLMYLRSTRILDKVRRNIYRSAQWEVSQNIAVLEDSELTRRLFTKEVADIFSAQVEALPKITRAVFLSSRDDNLTYTEIAAKYGLSYRQVSREMQRALAFLRIALKDYL